MDKYDKVLLFIFVVDGIFLFIGNTVKCIQQRCHKFFLCVMLLCAVGVFPKNLVMLHKWRQWSVKEKKWQPMHIIPFDDQCELKNQERRWKEK